MTPRLPLLGMLAALPLAALACTPTPRGPDDDDDRDDDAADDDAADDDAADDDAADDDGADDDGADDDGADDDATAEAEVTITWPGDGATVGGYIEVEVETSQGMDEVQLIVSGDEVGRADVSNRTALLGWDSGMMANGGATLKARDPDSGVSDTVDVSVSNGDLVTYLVGTAENSASGTGPLFAWHAGSLASITYTIVGSREDSYYLTVVEDADGNDLIDSNGDPYDDPVPAFATESPFTALVPNNPEVSLAEGEWTIWPVNTGEEGTADLWAQVKRGRGGIEAGLLDIVCYFVSGSGLTAAQAQTSGSFQGMLSDMQDILLQADVALGEVDYEDISDSSYSTVSSYEEYGELLAETRERGRVLNLVFIDRFSSEFSGVLGVAGGIPGPTDFHGERSSGVVVSLEGDWGTTALTATHETGHYLGLYHPVETVAGYFDPLTDTAECTYPCNGNAITDNLMWPILLGGWDLTQDQQWVIIRHPAVRFVDGSELPLAAAAPTPSIPPPPDGTAPRCGSTVLAELRAARGLGP